MAPTKFTTIGMLVFPDLGKDGKVTGPFPGLTVTAKRTMKDVEFSLNVPAAKAAKEQSLNGTLLGLKNNWSEQSTCDICIPARKQSMTSASSYTIAAISANADDFVSQKASQKELFACA